MRLEVALLVTLLGWNTQQTPPQPAPQSVYENLVYRAGADNQETQEVRLLLLKPAVLDSQLPLMVTLEPLWCCQRRESRYHPVICRPLPLRVRSARSNRLSFDEMPLPNSPRSWLSQTSHGMRKAQDCQCGHD